MMRCVRFGIQSVRAFTPAVFLLCSCTAFADGDSVKSEPEAGRTSRQTILEQAGLWPLPALRPSVTAIVEHRRKHSGYSVENVAIEIAPGCDCTGNLYRPLLRHDLGPAVLLIDGHTHSSNSHEYHA